MDKYLIYNSVMETNKLNEEQILTYGEKKTAPQLS